MAFVLPLVGAAVGAVGALASANAQSSAASYQAKIAANNAAAAGMQRASAISAGHERAAEASLAGAEQIGKMKAAQAATGVDVNTGSAVDVRGSRRMLNQLQSENALSNAQRAAWGYQLQELGFADQSDLYKAEASSARTAGYLGAASDILGAVPKLIPEFPGFGDNVKTGT